MSTSTDVDVTYMSSPTDTLVEKTIISPFTKQHLLDMKLLHNYEPEQNRLFVFNMCTIL